MMSRPSRYGFRLASSALEASVVIAVVGAAGDDGADRDGRW